MPGVMHGVLLWADMNAATPPGSRGRFALCAGGQAGGREARAPAPAEPQHEAGVVRRRRGRRRGWGVGRGRSPPRYSSLCVCARRCVCVCVCHRRVTVVRARRRLPPGISTRRITAKSTRRKALSILYGVARRTMWACACEDSALYWRAEDNKKRKRETTWPPGQCTIAGHYYA